MSTAHLRQRNFNDPLPDYIVDALVRAAQDAYPNEACGFIMMGAAPLVLRCNNVHKNPKHHFEIDHRELEAVYDNEDRIIGMYHSHPNGPDTPSESDKRWAPTEGIRYFIVTRTHVFEYDSITWEVVR